MGNHDIGRGMAAAAKVFWLVNGEAPVSPEKALLALDAMAEDYIGGDAEFDDEFCEETDLSRLVAIAFEATEEELADLRGETEGDDAGELWYSGPYRKFSARYKFC